MRNAQKVFIGVIFCIILAIFLIPSYSLALGNVFFGEIKPLYNVRIAQFFFQVSTHPLFTKLPPRYAHYQLARTYFIRGILYDAIDEAETELKIYPDDTVAYYLLGLTYGYMDRTYEAIDAFSQYIEAHPETWAGRNDKAWLEFRLGDIDGALATIEPIADNFRYTPWVQNTYCALLLNKEDLAMAETVCTHAKEAIDKMTAEDWGRAYPGNDPRTYGDGLKAMKASIESNLEILASRKSAKNT